MSQFHNNRRPQPFAFTPVPNETPAKERPAAWSWDFVLLTGLLFLLPILPPRETGPWNAVTQAKYMVLMMPVRLVSLTLAVRIVCNRRRSVLIRSLTALLLPLLFWLCLRG